jgi:ribosome-associated protein
MSPSLVKRSSPRSRRPTPLKLLGEIVAILEDRKAEEIVVMDIRRLSSFTDYFVLATALHERHIQALREHLLEKMKVFGIHPMNVEGTGTTWNIIDFQDVIVHLFDSQSRRFYDLEHLWLDAPRVSRGKLLRYRLSR